MPHFHAADILPFLAFFFGTAKDEIRLVSSWDEGVCLRLCVYVWAIVYAILLVSDPIYLEEKISHEDTAVLLFDTDTVTRLLRI